MKPKKVYILLFLIPLLSFSSIHKYYLSLTQIEYNNESKSVQIIINVFIDDIETALNKDFSINLKLNSKNELPDNDVYFNKYLKEKLALKIDDTLTNFKYLGKEYDADLVYFYLEIENIEEVKSIEITNKILMYHFPTQQNLIKCKIGTKHKSALLVKENNKGLLKF